MSLTLIGEFDVYPPTFDVSGTDTRGILPFMYHYHDTNPALMIPYLAEPQRMSAPASSRRPDFVSVASPFETHWIPGIYARARTI